MPRGYYASTLKEGSTNTESSSKKPVNKFVGDSSKGIDSLWQLKDNKKVLILTAQKDLYNFSDICANYKNYAARAGITEDKSCKNIADLFVSELWNKDTSLTVALCGIGVKENYVPSLLEGCKLEGQIGRQTKRSYLNSQGRSLG